MSGPRVALPAAIEAVLFDLDGVVTDTQRAHAEAWKRVLDAFLESRSARTGEPFVAFDIATDYHRYVDGKPRADGVESFLASRGIELERGSSDDPPGTQTAAAIGAEKDGAFKRHLAEHGVEAFPGTVRLVNALRERGLGVAVFSASRNLRAVLEAGGIADLFEVTVDGVDAAELGLPGKPDPATLLEAARRLGVAPSRAAVVEDAIAGVKAGRAGGFAFVVGVDRGSGVEALAGAGADVVVGDLGEVEPPA